MDSGGAEASRRRGRQAAFRYIYVNALMSAVTFSIIHPTLPHLVRQLAGGDTADAAEWMMLFAMVWGVAQLVCAPVLGSLSDRFGRRPVLLASFFGLGLDLLFMAFAPTLALLLLGRAISGATAGAFSTAHAYVADVTPEAERAGAFGKLASAMSIGFMLGPAAGGWLGAVDLRLPFLAAGAITLANGLYGVFVLPESLPPERRTTAWRKGFGFGALGVLRRRPELRLLAGISFLAQLANMIWASVFVLFAAHRFGWSAMEMGLSMVASGLAGVAVQAWVVGRVVKAVGEAVTLRIGAAVSAAALLFAAWAPNGWWFIAAIPPSALGLLMMPGLQGLMSRSVDEKSQGQLQGAVQSLNGLAIIIGPPLFGLTFAWSLRHSLGVDLSGLALAISGAILGLAFALSLAVGSRADRAD